MAAKPPPAAVAGLLALGVVVLQGLLILWFAWPAGKTAPRDLPVVVAGPAQATETITQRLHAGRPGGFAVTTVPDAAAADQALRDRTAYAAFVVGGTGPVLHVASAAGPTVTALLTQAAQQLGNGQPVPVVDVVPAPRDDPRGAGFASGFLPLVMTSLAAGIGLLFAVRAALSGLGAALGRPGIGLGVLVVFLLGNPISGLTSAPELLPQPWGAIGQYLPPGAGGTLLRSVAFFDGARATGPALVLGAWAVVGLALTAFGHYRDRRASHAAGQLGVPPVDRDERRLGAER